MQQKYKYKCTYKNKYKCTYKYEDKYKCTYKYKYKMQLFLCSAGLGRVNINVVYIDCMLTCRAGHHHARFGLNPSAVCAERALSGLPPTSHNWTAQSRPPMAFSGGVLVSFQIKKIKKSMVLLSCTRVLVRPQMGDPPTSRWCNVGAFGHLAALLDLF